ncbi:hypothetical protein [Actinomadura rubrisoli]|uniref:Uncharacterized protein n=1 Tax=Actinomadura rubrisoli TaxID=2530368 RepID=A0A4R5CF85_9ACTN|nr:hypothetical protein [Actinomadura rubrisoli]TDD97616.1 hypothetical protein E1298_00875 [Actinomadura rubrisoli]
MPALLLDSDTFPFADGNAGHLCDLGAAPAVGDLDVLCVNSDTVVTMPSGFSAATSRVANQGSYLWYRKAVGGEAATVTITTSGNFNCQVSWSRWRGVDAFDKSAVAGADASAGSATPTATTAGLAATNELSIGFGAIHGAVTSSPVWSSGYTPLSAVTQGTGVGASTGYVAYRTDAGTAAEAPSVSWTTPAPDRYMLVATFTTVAATTVNAGQATETDTALPASPRKARTAGQAVEADSALAVQAITKLAVAGMATETDTALPAALRKTLTAGQATETDSAFPATARKVVYASIAVDTETALPATRTKRLAAGQAVEADSAPAPAVTKTIATGLAVETDTARPATALKVRRAGIAVETDTALHATAGELVDITVTVGPLARGWTVGEPARGWSVGAPTT